jgi:hypothetical protein
VHVFLDHGAAGRANGVVKLSATANAAPRLSSAYIDNVAHPTSATIEAGVCLMVAALAAAVRVRLSRRH